MEGDEWFPSGEILLPKASTGTPWCPQGWAPDFLGHQSFMDISTSSCPQECLGCLMCGQKGTAILRYQRITTESFGVVMYAEARSYHAAQAALELASLLPQLIAMHLNFWKMLELLLAAGAGDVFMSTSWIAALFSFLVDRSCPQYTMGSTKALTVHGLPHTNELQTQVLNPTTWSQSF